MIFKKAVFAKVKQKLNENFSETGEKDSGTQ